MITVIGILTGAVLGTRYKVLCLVPITLAGAAALAALDQLNQVPLSSTALTALALAVGLQIGYLVGVTVRSRLLAALASSVSEPERLRDQPARIS
jgi:membrane protein DedA with SNARE-associated domain